MCEEDPDFGPILVEPAEVVEAWRRGRARVRPAAKPGREEVTASPAPSNEATAAVAAKTDASTAPPIPLALPPPRPPRPSGQVLRPSLLGWRSLGATLVLVLAVWASTGFYKVQPDQVGIVLRFGRWTETRGPGLNYHLPYPIETVLLPRVTEVNQLKIGNGAVTQMLTGDENIVEATAAVSWRIKDPGKFLFEVSDPEATVRVAAESAVREIIALNPIQSGLSDQREKIADDVRTLLQHMLDFYQIGIQITQVQLQRVDPPTAVIDAFNDVQRARADQQRARNEAEAYRNDILPRARGEAERIKQEAEAYAQQVTNAAKSDASRFLALKATFRQAPDITARRLYLETMEEVLKAAGKVLVDPSGHAGGSAVFPYLSLNGGPAPVPAMPVPPKGVP